jgi:hypothetical protein
MESGEGGERGEGSAKGVWEPIVRFSIPIRSHVDLHFE